MPSSEASLVHERQIADNLSRVLSQLPEGVGLVAVSKFHPIQDVRAAYDAGQRMFGESRAQELLAKAPVLPRDIQWHFIGHLQSNKVAHVLPHVSLIESVDTERLLYIIDREAAKQGLQARVLMQVRVTDEMSKTGFTPLGLLRFFANRGYDQLQATRICGIMGMATNTPNMVRVAEDMRRIRALYDEIRRLAPDLEGFDIVSMGMSHDWPEAVEAGSNLVRIGTAIFGPRQ